MYITYWGFGDAYWQTRQLDKAIGNLPTAASLNDIFAIRSYLGADLALNGQADEAFSILREFEEKVKNEYVSPLCWSVVYMSLGDFEQGLKWLEKAWNVSAIHLLRLAVEPTFDSIRAEETRFLNIYRKMDLPE